MAKQIPYKDRYPDFGISHKEIGSKTTAHKLLRYGLFKRVPFTREDYVKFRVSNDISKDMFMRAMEKLIGLGFMASNADGSYVITETGKDATIRIARRDAMRNANED